MDSQTVHVMTLANSIIGVGILAMPYCFKQCGIILSIIFLLLSSIISRLACHFLLKSAIKSRLKTFEFLAFHAFGSIGKLMIEIGMIGFLIGTCIAFFVVMGDLGPQIVNEITGFGITSTMRTSILIAIALFCILPLGLLRNVDSLSGVCTATIAFYGCLVLKIIVDSVPHLLSGDWFNKVVFWRPAGILQCIPIFSMALFCQTQLFEIYQAIPNASLEKMNSLIRTAVNICTCVYIFVGTFGYVAVAHLPFTGNILISLTPSIVTSTMKIGFVLSVAFSFPLIIFPCRASLYSLLYKNGYTIYEGTTNFIPEGKFKGLTFIIVLVSLITGVLIPNIELVLGLVGSTIGVMICVIFPATCFICLSQKNTNERIAAQIMLCIGIVVMVLGTYANLYAFEEVNSQPSEKIALPIVNLNVKNEDTKIKLKDLQEIAKELPELIQKAPDIASKKMSNPVQVIEEEIAMKEIRHEPPQPEAPVDPPKEDNKNADNKQDFSDEKKVDIIEANKVKLSLDIAKAKENAKVVENSLLESKIIQENIVVANNVQLEANNINKNEIDKNKKENKNINNKEVKNEPANSENVVLQETLNKLQNKKPHEKIVAELKKGEEVDIEAIKKEDKEIQQQFEQKDNKKVAEVAKPVEEGQKKHSEKLLQDQVKAIKEIEMIAKKAIGDIVRNITHDTAKQENKADKIVKEESQYQEKSIEVAKDIIQNIVESKQLDNNIPQNVISTNDLTKNNLNSKKVPKDTINNFESNNIVENKLPQKLNDNNNVDNNNKLASQETQINLKDTQKDKFDFKNLIPIPVVKKNNLQSIYANNLTKLNISINQTKSVKEVKAVEVILTNNEEVKGTLPPLDLMQVLKGSKEPFLENAKKSLKTEQVNVNLLSKENVKNTNEDLKALRRDILSAHERAKRESVLAKDILLTMSDDKHCDKKIASPDRK